VLQPSLPLPQVNFWSAKVLHTVKVKGVLYTYLKITGEDKFYLTTEQVLAFTVITVLSASEKDAAAAALKAVKAARQEKGGAAQHETGRRPGLRNSA